VDLGKRGCEGADKIKLAQEKFSLRDIYRHSTELPDSIKRGNLLTR
jgi:hypothetical protein